MGTSPIDEIAQIPSGKLFLRRLPQSPKGELECLYNDALAEIRRTTTPYVYHLLVTKVHHEDAGMRVDTGYDSDSDSDSGHLPRLHQLLTDVANTTNSKEEWNFAIIEEMRFHFYERNGNKIFAWRDLNGDMGDEFEFIIGEEARGTDVESFTLQLYKCLYEEKYKTEVRNMEDIQEFGYDG